MALSTSDSTWYLPLSLKHEVMSNKFLKGYQKYCSRKFFSQYKFPLLNKILQYYYKTRKKSNINKVVKSLSSVDIAQALPLALLRRLGMEANEKNKLSLLRVLLIFLKFRPRHGKYMCAHLRCVHTWFPGTGAQLRYLLVTNVNTPFFKVPAL